MAVNVKYVIFSAVSVTRQGVHGWYAQIHDDGIAWIATAQHASQFERPEDAYKLIWNTIDDVNMGTATVLPWHDEP